MYTLPRYFIKTSLVCLLLGLLTGFWMLIGQVLGFAVPGTLRTAHTHLLLVGFLVQMVFGVALWMFPRPPKGPDRYKPALAGASFGLIAGGTFLRFFCEVGMGISLAALFPWGVLAGALAQVAGIALFIFNLWPRIRPLGSHLREAQGERF